MKKNAIRLTESQLHRVIKESVKKVLKEDYSFGQDELEDMPEYRTSKYYKFVVVGHTYKEPSPEYNKKRGMWMPGFPEVDYPEEEFDNIEDARECAKRFKKMPYSIPSDVRIKAYYHTVSDDDWEYVS